MEQRELLDTADGSKIDTTTLEISLALPSTVVSAHALCPSSSTPWYVH